MTKRVYPVKLGKPNPAHPKYSTEAAITIPDVVDLSVKCSAVKDQGQSSSCTAQSISSALEYLENVENESFIQLSPLFLYWAERSLEGDLNEDAGAIISDGVQIACSTGICAEALFPFSENRLYVRPPLTAFNDAKNHRGLQFHAVNQTQDAIEHCLASGNVIVFGISVFSSMETDEVMQTGVIPMPSAADENMGGHAILMTGYDRVKRLFTFKNSWGNQVGLPNLPGYFTLPYEYVLNPNLASEFFTITKVS
jgi:C1A family cysteine protease